MFFLVGYSSSTNSCEVLDTNDGVVELVDTESLRKVCKRGVEVIGINPSNNTVNPVRLELDYGEYINKGMLDREYAIIVTNGKFYITDTNHQSLLVDILRDREQNLKEVYGVSDVYDDIDKFCDITYNAFKANEMYGFDIVNTDDGVFLVSHFEENLINCYHMMLAIAEERGIGLATYIRGSADMRVVLGLNAFV